MKKQPEIYKANRLIGKNIILRNAAISDAEFILALRLDCKKSRHLSHTTNSVLLQKEWLTKYATRDNEAYFIIENKNGETLGTVRLYDNIKDSFCWGSWIIKDGAPQNVAIESAIIVYLYGLDILGFKSAHFRVNKTNKSVCNFHERFGAKRISETHLEFEYIITNEAIRIAIERYGKYSPTKLIVEKYMETELKINKQADLKSIGTRSEVHIDQFVMIHAKAQIGCDVNISSHCLVENDVIIGDRVTIKSGVQLWDGLRVGDDVFIGPNVTFTNEQFPRSKASPEILLETKIENGASIGGGAVILPRINIGVGSIVGAGAVVTKSVPPYAIVMGNPARIVGYVEGSPASVEIESNLLQPSFTTKQAVTRLNVGDVTLHRLKVVPDMRGDLSVGEFEKDIPFVPKRYFLVFNVPSEKTRGEHAHRKCHQFLLCIKGSCSVVVDDGLTRKEVKLDSPELGLHLPPMTWGIQYKYTPDAVLLVFTSHYYDARDYIRNYSEFLNLSKLNSDLNE